MTTSQYSNLTIPIVVVYRFLLPFYDYVRIHRPIPQKQLHLLRSRDPKQIKTILNNNSHSVRKLKPR